MEHIFYILFGLFLGLILSFYLVFIANRLRSENTKFKIENAKLTEKLELLNTQQKKDEIQQEKDKNYLETKFKNMAQEILKANQNELTETSKKTLDATLAPMEKELKEFKSKVQTAHEKNIQTAAAFKEQFEFFNKSNQKIMEEAHSLTQALKGDKQKQGAWGEVILERVLEASGLRAGEEFELQKNLTDVDQKRYRPDALIYMPDDRQVIIDAKTSLNAYKEAVNADDEKQKIIFLQQHTKNIENHFNRLSEKKYQYLEKINTLDFVLMFVPIEGALLMALNHKPDLYDLAFRQNIVLVSPSTLLLALRTIEAAWRHEHQHQNIKKISERATKMYEKFAGFMEDMEKINKNLKTALDCHQSAVNKLALGRGNLVDQAKDLKKISGIKPSKQLPSHVGSIERQ